MKLNNTTQGLMSSSRNRQTLRHHKSNFLAKFDSNSRLLTSNDPDESSQVDNLKLIYNNRLKQHDQAMGPEKNKFYSRIQDNFNINSNNLDMQQIDDSTSLSMNNKHFFVKNGKTGRKSSNNHLTTQTSDQETIMVNDQKYTTQINNILGNRLHDLQVKDSNVPKDSARNNKSQNHTNTLTRNSERSKRQTTESFYSDAKGLGQSHMEKAHATKDSFYHTNRFSTATTRRAKFRQTSQTWNENSVMDKTALQSGRDIDVKDAFEQQAIDSNKKLKFIHNPQMVECIRKSGMFQPLGTTRKFEKSCSETNLVFKDHYGTQRKINSNLKTILNSDVSLKLSQNKRYFNKSKNSLHDTMDENLGHLAVITSNDNVDIKNAPRLFSLIDSESESDFDAKNNRKANNSSLTIEKPSTGRSFGMIKDNAIFTMNARENLKDMRLLVNPESKGPYCETGEISDQRNLKQSYQSDNLKVLKTKDTFETHFKRASNILKNNKDGLKQKQKEISDITRKINNKVFLNGSTPHLMDKVQAKMATKQKATKFETTHYLDKSKMEKICTNFSKAKPVTNFLKKKIMNLGSDANNLYSKTDEAIKENRRKFVQLITFSRATMKFSTLKYGFFKRIQPKNGKNYFNKHDCRQATQEFQSEVHLSLKVDTSYRYLYTIHGNAINDVVELDNENWIILCTNFPDFNGKTSFMKNMNLLQNNTIKKPPPKIYEQGLYDNISPNKTEYKNPEEEYLKNLYEKIGAIELKYSAYFDLVFDNNQNFNKTNYIINQPIENLVKKKYEKEINYVIEQIDNEVNGEVKYCKQGKAYKRDLNLVDIKHFNHDDQCDRYSMSSSTSFENKEVDQDLVDKMGLGNKGISLSKLKISELNSEKKGTLHKKKNKTIQKENFEEIQENIEIKNIIKNSEEFGKVVKEIEQNIFDELENTERDMEKNTGTVFGNSSMQVTSRRFSRKSSSKNISEEDQAVENDGKYKCEQLIDDECGKFGQGEQDEFNNEDHDLFTDQCAQSTKRNPTKQLFGDENSDYYNLLKLQISTYSMDTMKSFKGNLTSIEEKIDGIVNKIDWKKVKLYENLLNNRKNLSIIQINKYLKSSILHKIIKKFVFKYKQSAECVIDLIKDYYSRNEGDSDESGDLKLELDNNIAKKEFENLYEKISMPGRINKPLPPKEFPYDEERFQKAQRESQFKEINEYYIGMVNLNIPKMVRVTGFMRKDLHDYYTLFKALVSVTSQRYNKENYKVKRGVDYETFRNGIFYIYLQPKNISLKIFKLISEKFSNFLDWPRFLTSMKMIKGKSQQDRVDLFIQIATGGESNKNFYKDDIHKFCRDSMMNITREAKTPPDLEYLIEYFTKFIFKTCNVPMDQPIHLEKIKELITNGHPDSNLLCMFCSADI